jgi:hypothetical protein
MIFRLGGLWLVGLSCAVMFGACAPSSSEVGSMNPGGGGQGPECEAGATKPAGDGCNSCTCGDEGGWSCTQLVCSVCEEGAVRAAEDGCNTCVCAGGEWACSRSNCQNCTIGAIRETDCGSCWCADNGNGPVWNCTANACNECVEGETKPGENDCSTCTCGPDGHWDCQVVECPECTAGETRAAGDGCNTCMCINGTWSCTMKFCGEPTCNPGFVNCDGDAGNGCETHLDTSVEHCGLCGNHCAIAGAHAACEAGTCVIDRCDPPYADCNGDPADGCESPVGANGCAGRCQVPSMLMAPVPAEGTCDCPEGTACVRGSTADENESSEYCFPIPEGCTGGFANCSCMTDCACPAGARTTCYDEMSSGGMIINCAGYP